MTDYRSQPSDSPDKPDFVVGDDILSFDQMTALLLTAQDGGDVDQVVQDISDGKIK